MRAFLIVLMVPLAAGAFWFGPWGLLVTLMWRARQDRLEAENRQAAWERGEFT